MIKRAIRIDLPMVSWTANVTIYVYCPAVNPAPGRYSHGAADGFAVDGDKGSTGAASGVRYRDLASFLAA